jgi:hypothetical protein
MTTHPHALSSLRSSDRLTEAQRERAHSPLGIAWAEEIDRLSLAEEDEHAFAPLDVNAAMAAGKVRADAVSWVMWGRDTIRDMADSGYGAATNALLVVVRDRLLTYPDGLDRAIDDAERDAVLANE